MSILNFWKRDDSSSTSQSAEQQLTTPQPEVNDVLLKAYLSNGQVTREQAMTVPAVSAAVDFISNTVASMPVKLYKYKDGSVERRDDDPRVQLLNGDTGDTLDAFQMKKNMVRDYLMGSGGYAYIRKNRNDVTGLFHVRDDYVAVQMLNADPIHKSYKLFVYTNEYELHEFIKLLRNTVNGADGVGLTQEIGKALQTAYQTLLYQLTLAKSGGSKKGFLKSQRKLGQNEIDSLKNAWANLYGNNSENVVVLNNGLEFQEASESAQEMQLDQNKKTLTDEINNVFHIYPDDFYRTFKEAIYPIIKAFETALNRDLLLEREKKAMFFEFDTKEILRVNIEERYKAYKLAKETGFMTINEIRRAENMNRIEGMDVINVGLASVLYDTNTHQYYTPNTDSLTDPSDGSHPDETDAEKEEQHLEQEIVNHEAYDEVKEEGNVASLRYNPNHDAKTGRFGFGSGGGSGSSSGGAGGGKEGSDGGGEGGAGGASEKALGDKVKAETDKVNSRLSNESKPIKQEKTNLKEVKDRGGLSDAEAKRCAAIAENIYSKAAAKEPKITSDVVSSTESVGGKMYGLDYRLKQSTSMAGKIGADSKEDGVSFEKAGNGIKDSIRYTAVIPEKNFTQGYNQIKKSMEDKGYTEVRCKNFYEMYEKGTSCQKAVQSVYKDKDGQFFEFQFHTPSSQGAKELNHPLYEEQRKSTTSASRKKELNDQMTRIGTHVVNPEGVLTIKSH